MIYFFSGTGNSAAVARRLGEAVRLNVAPIVEASAEIRASSAEPVGIVFPVYAWGLPKAVRTFIERADWQVADSAYVFAVMTCGDDVGRTDVEVRRRLKRKGVSLDAVWSVTMPNTYTALPGFNVDADELAERKLRAAKGRVDDIARRILARERGVCNVHPGALPSLKSSVIRPLFNALLLSHTRLSVDADACIGCRACESACPLDNITPNAFGNPRFGEDCTGCLGCYHACPRHAIAYSRFTAGKGQYTFARFSKFFE